MLVHHSLSNMKLSDAATKTLIVGAWDAPDTEYEQLVERASDEPIDEPVTLDDLSLLPFTSGTTGAPKGVMLSHGNLTWNVINGLSAIDFRADDVTVAAAPFFRVGGIGVNVLPVLFKGGTVVIPTGPGADSVFEAIEREKATVGFGNPDLLEAITRLPGWRSADLSALRLFITGGAPVSERLLATCCERGFNVLQGYGLTEAAPLVSVLDGESSARKVGSAGRPALFVDIQIVRPDAAPAAAGEVGELLVRGPNVTAGYWKRDTQRLQATMDDKGWLRTGDAVYADREGFLFIVGRVQDAYVWGGRLVHPGIAERLLLLHPGVADACIVGADDGAVAYVVAEADAEVTLEKELALMCLARLPAHARPSEIRRVSCLPKNPAGKVLRHLIRVRPEPCAAI
jgi:fatty-acyl-CoA synthase